MEICKFVYVDTRISEAGWGPGYCGGGQSLAPLGTYPETR